MTAMKTPLIMTVGQTDVQLVVGGQRHKLDGNTCGALHDAIRKRSWSVIDAPGERCRDLIKTLPDGELRLCTPKLDALLSFEGGMQPTSALIFETTRDGERDPRLSGEVVEHRLRERGISQVKRVAFLTGTEQLEDTSNDLDAVVRRAVVATLSNAIGQQVGQLNKGDRVLVATTGGLAAANELINELVRLHAVGGPSVTVLEVPDRDRVQGEDVAVPEKFHPAAGYRARWQALSLVERGSFIGAWGAVSHLENVPGQEWTKVVKWLYNFASSLPNDGCEIEVLKHPRMAVRSALRVELALRAGDIPRAVHGTVAFFESALWDKLYERLERSPDPKKRRYFKVKSGDAPSDELLRVEGAKDNLSRPFQRKEKIDDTDWYWVYDGDGGPSVRLAKSFLQSESLTELAKVFTRTNQYDENFYSLRNDVAHNEPTPSLMADARQRMQEAGLWSSSDTFLSQPLVQDVLRELGESEPSKLLEALLAEVRRRLTEPTAS
jgi:hypothetical protein